jgi:hypothetical protein
MKYEVLNDRPNRLGILSGSTIKIIACISMLIDHMGYLFFPYVEIFRIIGRIAFPLFAYFIAEGSYYTRKPLKRVLILFSLSILFIIAYYIVDGIIYINVFTSFSIAALCIYILDKGKSWAFKSKDYIPKLLLIIFLISIILIPVYYMCNILIVDYGFVGVLLPIIISLVYFKKYKAPKYLCIFDNYYVRMILFTLGLVLLDIYIPFSVQSYHSLAIIPLILYNGKPGCKKLKWGFYLFYPIHMLVLYGIYYLMYLL